MGKSPSPAVRDREGLITMMERKGDGERREAEDEPGGERTKIQAARGQRQQPMSVLEAVIVILSNQNLSTIFKGIS